LFILAQIQDVAKARAALAPSSAAAMPAFKREQVHHPVLNGRPCHNFGPPIGLFHPVFDLFQIAMKTGGPFSAETYTLVKAFCQASAEIYSNEDRRTEAIDKPLQTLLDRRFLQVTESGVKSDGVITQALGNSVAFIVVREIKNEIGTGSADPYNQGSLSYRKYWASGSRK
jgi:hypothetical protein